MATETEINIRNMEEDWPGLCEAYEAEMAALRYYLEQLGSGLGEPQGIPPTTPSRFFRR